MEAFFYAQPRNGAAAASLRKSIRVLAFPGETVEVSGSMDDYHMKGNAFHQAYEEVRALYKPYEDKMHKVTQVIMDMQSKGMMTRERLDSLRQIYEPINADMKKVKEDYIRQHPDEDISVYLISDFGKTASDLLDLIGEKAQNGPMAPLYKAMKEAIERQKAREEARKQEYGRRSRSPRLHTEGPPRQRPHPVVPARQVCGAGLLGKLVRLVHQGYPRHEEILRKI